MFQAITDYGMTRRAIERGLLAVKTWDVRDFTEDKRQTVDDRPYGGGPGMVMQVSPLRKAIQAARKEASKPAKVIYVSPQGERLTVNRLQSLALETHLIFVAGRYEGVDERLLELEVDQELSIGDYVLSGGELAVMVILDAMARWVPGVLGHEASAIEDSFSAGLLDCPHYTRPEVIEGLTVPDVLLSGDHAAIFRWRLKQKLGRTWLRRKDLLEGLELDPDSQALLQEFIREYERSGS